MSEDFIAIYWFIVKCFSVIIALICLLAILLYKYQNRIIYLPEFEGCPRSPSKNKFGLQNPSQMQNHEGKNKDNKWFKSNLEYEDVYIPTEDNLILHGWIAKQRNSHQSPTIVYFHENAGNIGTRLHFMKEYCDQALVNIILIAYRGYSNSEGKPTEKGLMKDAKAILTHLFSRSDIDITKIFLHGRSLGGAVAIFSAAELKFAVCGVIVENTFTSLSDMADIQFKHIRFLKELVLHNYWPSITRISRIKCPILFISSIKDEFIPSEQMDRLFKNATNARFKHLHQIPDGTHNNSWFMDPTSYFDSINEFMQNCKNDDEPDPVKQSFRTILSDSYQGNSNCTQVEYSIDISQMINDKVLETKQLLTP